MITVAQLNHRLGQSMVQICPNGYSNPDDNHCAHYVSHVLTFRFATTCRTMQTGSSPGASIRVQEIFARCPQVGKWDDRPSHVHVCLAFVCDSSYVDIPRKTMTNVPQKHIGIYSSGLIWHYSNSKSQVVSVMPKQFRHHYHGSNIALFYGTMPGG